MAGELRFNYLLDRGYGKRGRLIGWPKKAVSSTVSVNPAEIAAGATGTVTVTVAGAKVHRRSRVIMLPPATLEAGLRPLGTPITSVNTVTLTLQNTSDGAINGAALNWTALLFSMALPHSTPMTPSTAVLTAAGLAPTRTAS